MEPKTEDKKAIALKEAPAIELTNLCKSFDHFQLKNINLTLPKGMIMGFIGENGAGKTTTIKLLLNQLKRDQGSIRILGLDPVKDETLVKEQVGVVLDEGFFYENLTPKNISQIMSKLYANWDSPLFFQYLEKFQVPSQQIIKELSRGMRMKLSLICALSHHPQLLLLDEPTGGLDPVVRNQILDLFLDFIQDEAHSILFSSHITGDLEKIADYITFIHEGEIVLSQSKDVLLTQYGLLKCGNDDFKKVSFADYISYRKSPFGYEALVKEKSAAEVKYPQFLIDNVTLEDIMMFYINK